MTALSAEPQQKSSKTEKAKLEEIQIQIKLVDKSLAALN